MDASRIEAKILSAISYACRDTTRNINHLMGKMIGDVPLFVTETMVI